jgi:hypothetical protein
MFTKAQIQAGAKSANEQQNTPSKKSCCSKTESVIFRFSQLTLLNRFQQKPSPFKLIAFVGKLDQDSGAYRDTLRVKVKTTSKGP